MNTLEPILVEHPLLKDLDTSYLQFIIGCARNVRFKAGDYLFREGEQADKFYLIREGRVSLDIYSPNAGPITIQTLGNGEVLGWSWLVPPYRWYFDAQAVEATRAFELDGKCLREKCEANSNLGYELMKRFAQIIAQRLQATRMQLLDVYGVRY
ncbi:MAG: cyclic nucleotide-binding domain-containing protein [Acidobacteriota bacterium]